MTETRHGHIHRIVESLGMGYIADPKNDRLWSFLFPQMVGYAGQYPEEIGLAEASPVAFTLEDGKVTSVLLQSPVESLAQSNAQ